jgi:hypothetical protein
MVVAHQVADRPDRFEPRLLKVRPKPYRYIRKPRAVIKQEMAKGNRQIYAPFVDFTVAVPTTSKKWTIAGRLIPPVR